MGTRPTGRHYSWRPMSLIWTLIVAEWPNKKQQSFIWFCRSLYKDSELSIAAISHKQRSRCCLSLFFSSRLRSPVSARIAAKPARILDTNHEQWVNWWTTTMAHDGATLPRLSTSKASIYMCILTGGCQFVPVRKDRPAYFFWYWLVQLPYVEQTATVSSGDSKSVHIYSDDS